MRKVCSRRPQNNILHRLVLYETWFLSLMEGNRMREFLKQGSGRIFGTRTRGYWMFDEDPHHLYFLPVAKSGRVIWAGNVTEQNACRSRRKDTESEPFVLEEHWTTDTKQTCGRLCTALVWLGMETSGGSFWTRVLILGFRKMRVKSWLPEQLLASQERLFYT
jgi:hypothetical protein